MNAPVLIPNFGDPAELDALLRAWDGKGKTPLILTREQELRALYIVAAKRPCLVCLDAEPAVVGDRTLPERYPVYGGMRLVFGLCRRCHDHPEREALIWTSIDADVQCAEMEMKENSIGTPTT